MSNSHIVDDLEARGLIYQCSDPEGIREFLATPQTLYCGFDPTADSLHIGNLLPLMCLRRFQLAGHKIIALMGGGTGLIGDPSGKSHERTLNQKETVDQWVDSIRAQVGTVIDLKGDNPAVIANNYDWLGSMNLITYLRDVGKHFPLGFMLAKDSVKSRLDSGISYTEFSYMILQAFDFFHLEKEMGCSLQIGGSDQWGNMTAGMDLIRRESGRPAFVITFPLITTADGKKFGKSEAGAIFMNPNRTSAYAFYQYWLNVVDQDAGRFMRYFTLLPISEIEHYETLVTTQPEKREAQQRLAWEVTAMVHGPQEADRAVKASQVLFGKADVRDLDARALEMAFGSAPRLQLRAGEIPPVFQMLIDGGLAKSKGEIRRLAQGGGLYLNGERLDDPELVPAPETFIQGSSLVLRMGKKNYLLVHRA